MTQGMIKDYKGRRRKYVVAKPVDMRDKSKGEDYIQDTNGKTKYFKSVRGAIKYLSKLEYPVSKSEVKTGQNSLGIYIKTI